MKPIQSWRKSIVMATLLGAVLAGAAVPAFAQAKRPEPPGTPTATAKRSAQAEKQVIAIPTNWKTLSPFANRFVSEAVVLAGRPVIDLKATRFTTDNLVAAEKTGAERFLSPDVASFKKTMVGMPFAAAREDYFLVQAVSHEAQASLRQWLDHSGIAVLDYIPQNAYLVRVNQQSLQEMQKAPGVEWVGHFKPAYRVDPILDYVTGTDPKHVVEIRVILDRAPYASAQDVEAAVAKSGAKVLAAEAGDSRWLVRVEGPVQLADTLALLPGCLWVERYVPRVLFNNTARTSSNVVTGRGTVSGPIMDVESVWAKGIHGEGQIAAASDTGLSTGNLATLHQDFGKQGDANNPMRVIKGYALGRVGDWSDPAALADGHGTHTSGSILSNGFRSGSTPSTNTYPATSYAGVAPKSQYVFQSVMDSGGGLGGIPANLNNLFLPPYNDGARVHSNSWGAPGAGVYNTDSQNVDKFAWEHKDMVITFSAGNDGRDLWHWNGSCVKPAGTPDGIIDQTSIGSPGTAKNCITLGASENYRPTFQYEYPQGTCNTASWGWFNDCNFSAAPLFADPLADNASGMAAFSSRGPTADGRIKPDLTAPGVAIISTRTDQTPAFSQWGECGIPAALQTYYLYMGGTSMANPLTAGAAVLLRQYYSDGWHRNHSATTNAAAVAGDAFSPSSALVKATLINGAWDMAPGQHGTGATREIPPSWDTGHDLPNNVEGYGRVDLMHSLFPGSGWGDNASRKMWVHDVTSGLQTGQFSSYTVSVTSGANPLVVTLVWTDPYGALSAATELVNNLDLTVTAPGGTVYYPNGLNKTSGVDTKNNVEQVKLTTPVLGTYMISVQGTAVPGNGQSGTTTQPFALVISGIVAPLASDKDFYVSDWNTSTSVYDSGTEPSSGPDWAYSDDVWNRSATTPGSPNANGWYPTDNMQAGTGTNGDNNAFVRVRRNGSGSAASVTAHFFVSPFGTGSSFADAGTGTDPVLSFGAGDTEKVLSTGYLWHQDATSSTHACLAVQIATADDPYKTPSLLGRTPGPDDYLVSDDNNKAQRNLGVSHNTPNGAGLAFALIHNSALFPRSIALRFESPFPDRLRGAQVEVIGGRTVELPSGGTITLEHMQPGENRWIAIRHQVPKDDPVPIHVSELHKGNPVNGFTVLAQQVTLGTAIRDNLRDHTQVFNRLAAALGAKAGTLEAQAASRLLEQKEISESQYRGFLRQHRKAMGSILEPLVGRGTEGDAFGALGALRAIGDAVTRNKPEQAASEHAMLLSRLDSLVTMLQKAKGDPADILQMVRWQEALFRTRPALQKLDGSARVVKLSQAFIQAFGRGKPEEYSALLTELRSSFHETAKAFQTGGEAIEKAAAAIERSMSSLPTLEKAHRAYLLAVQEAAGPIED